MATPEAIQRWRSVLLDTEKLDGLPRGQAMRAKFGSPEARRELAHDHTTSSLPHTTLLKGSLTSLVTDSVVR